MDVVDKDAFAGDNAGDNAGKLSRSTPHHEHIDQAGPEGTREAGKDYADRAASVQGEVQNQGPSPIHPAGDARSRRDEDTTAGGADDSLYETHPSECKTEAAEEKAHSE
jgi:hypothetical protein